MVSPDAASSFYLLKCSALFILSKTQAASSDAVSRSLIYRHLAGLCRELKTQVYYPMYFLLLFYDYI